MTDKVSNSERYRRERAQQVENRRVGILNVAAEAFLEKGLEQTTMLDIADRARISKVTLYRYFPNRDPIAFEVAVQMLRTIVSTAARRVENGVTGMRAIEGICLGMIREFPVLRKAYRYIGMFDHLYGDHYPSEELASWYKKHIFDLMAGESSPVSLKDLDEHNFVQIITLFNAIMSFLEKMAARGELMGREQEAPLQAQLEAFEGIVIVYLESLKGENHVQ